MCPKKRTTILALGKTGSGKSTLLNNIMQGEYLQTGDGAQSTTSETSLFKVIIDDCEINVIDTPGFYDSKGNEEQNYEQMITFLQNYDKGINLVIITFNANDIKLSEDIKILLQKLYQMFGTKKVFEHLCIVYTHYYCTYFIDSDKERLIKYSKEVHKEFMNIAYSNDIPDIPYFFIDSKPRTDDPFSVEQRSLLIDLAFKNNCLPTTSVSGIDPNVKEKITENRKHQIINQKIENGITSTTYADQIRNKIIYWNGTFGYDDWVNQNYEIIYLRHKTQRRTECDYHDAHSLFGFSSEPHTHYKTYIRDFDEQQIIKFDQNHNQTSIIDWIMVESTFKETFESEGEERGHGRQQRVVDVN